MPIGNVWINRLGPTVCLYVCFFVILCMCVFVRLRISPAKIKLAASNFARCFRGVLGRKSPILGNFAPPEAENWTNRTSAANIADTRQSPSLKGSARGTASARVDILPSSKTAATYTC